MAVNLIGQNIQLLLNQGQGVDIAKGLRPGDVIQARLSEILPDNKAIIQIKGMNLLAALPPAQAGQAFLKGMLLDLGVLQAKAPTQAQTAQTKNSAAPAAQTPALTLKLLGTNSNQTVSLNQLPQPAASAPSPSLENLLSRAQLPINSSNLQAVQSLSQHGLSLDRATVITVVQTTDNLLEAENSLKNVLAQPTQPTQPTTPLSNALNNAKTVLSTLIAQPQRAADKPVIQRLIQQLDQLETQTATHLAPAPEEPLPVLAVAPQATAPAVQAPLERDTAVIIKQIETATAQVAKAEPQALAQLETVLSSVASSQVHEAPAPPQKSASEPSASLSATTDPAPEISISLTHEVVAAVVTELTQTISTKAPLTQSSLQNKINEFSARVSEPESQVTDKLVASVKNQLSTMPELPTRASLQNAVHEALSQIKTTFEKQPLTAPLKTEGAVRQAFESRELGPIPQKALSQLPRETVLDAVVFLKARNLPTTRALVELVASELGKSADLSSTLHNIAGVEPQLSQGVLSMHPDLKQALENLKQFLNENSINPENKDLAEQIKTFVTKSGLNLENSLMQHATTAQPKAASNPVVVPQQNPEDSMKALLLKAKAEIQRALEAPMAQASSEVTGKLEHLGGQISSAINSLHTLALSARPTPAFDVTTVQLPMAIGGQMQNGQLSVYWKRGKPHELNAQDPVNVVFLLNTRSLGEVKVQLQVWKSECQGRVTTSSDAIRDFIKSDVKELKAGFERNTRFKLSSLDVTTKDASTTAAAGLHPLTSALENPRLNRGVAGLNITA